MEMMNFGFIGIGQAGGNIANVFAQEFPAIAINTAKNDLAVLANIKSSYRLHTDISEGGAGKSIRYGEKAIRRYQAEIIDLVNLNKDLKEAETIWLIAGLGGGTGSLGIIQMSVLLSKLGRKHSIILESITRLSLKGPVIPMYPLP
jgi:cell division GTPase FtsZ